ncbi:MAG: hypothetical protein DME24_24170 [Verrucomicrobia bacterium]|nr:MAG: hypothetical protein DME24_24170 [Verrucomicrobiota bacterium]
MTNDERNPNLQNQANGSGAGAIRLSFGFWYSFGIRHSGFAIIHILRLLRVSGLDGARNRMTFRLIQHNA